MSGEMTTVEKNGIVLPREAFGSSAQLTLTEIVQLGEIFHKSGAWPDARNAAMCIVKMLAGKELGFGPFASMSNVHIIDGKPSIGAHLMAAAIKRSDRYDFDTIERSREACELVFFERQLMTGGDVRKGVPGWVKKKQTIRMTFKEAVDSGLAVGKGGIKTNWARTPDAMLFARCISSGYRTHTPDLSSGVLAYDPDELDAPVQNLPTPQPVQSLSAPTSEAPRLPESNGVVPQEVEPQPTPTALTLALSVEQMDTIDDLVSKIGYKPVTFSQKVREEFAVADLSHLSAEQAEQLIARLKEALRKKLAKEVAARQTASANA